MKINLFQDRRKNEDDTPEWFHDGPTSQHDTIELRGFEEERDKGKGSKLATKKESAKERQFGNNKKTEDTLLVNGTSSRPGSSLSGKGGKDSSNTDNSDRLVFNSDFSNYGKLRKFCLLGRRRPLQELLKCSLISSTST